jgi:hypothetical protein
VQPDYPLSSELSKGWGIRPSIRPSNMKIVLSMEQIPRDSKLESPKFGFAKFFWRGKSATAAVAMVSTTFDHVECRSATLATG